MTTGRTEQGKLVWWLVNGLFAVLMAFLTFGVNRMAGYVDQHRAMIENNNLRIDVLIRDAQVLDREVERLRNFLGRQHDMPMQAPPE